MENIFNVITSWFQDVSNRKVVVSEFNNFAKSAYIAGAFPYLLNCSISRGNRAYKHSNSSFFYSGIRIVVKTSETLSDKELNLIGLSILHESRVVRLLITLGFDTLEVIKDNSNEGFRWKLIDFS